MTETNTSLGIRRGGGMTRWPRKPRKARMMAPAMLQRSPAKIPGATVAMPTFIASQVVPQTKQIKTNIARCDVVGDAFISVVDGLPGRGTLTHTAQSVPRLGGMARMRPRGLDGLDLRWWDGVVTHAPARPDPATS